VPHHEHAVKVNGGHGKDAIKVYFHVAVFPVNGEYKMLPVPVWIGFRGCGFGFLFLGAW
jgi:hypothetical protein